MLRDDPARDVPKPKIHPKANQDVTRVCRSCIIIIATTSFIALFNVPIVAVNNIN